MGNIAGVCRVTVEQIRSGQSPQQIAARDGVTLQAIYRRICRWRKRTGARRPRAIIRPIFSLQPGEC